MTGALTMPVGDRLKELRKAKDLSQMDLARASGIHNVQISKLERGITKEITGSTLRALCEALGVSPKYILGMTDDIESEQLAAATV